MGTSDHTSELYTAAKMIAELRWRKRNSISARAARERHGVVLPVEETETETEAEAEAPTDEE